MVSLLILLVPIVVVVLSFFPGHMSTDTLTQIEQARDGGFTNHHAPLLSALWFLVWPLGVGPGAVLVAQVALFVGAVYLVLRSFFGVLGAALSSAVIALSPPVFGMLGYLSRDTWFTALLLATFGLVLWSARTAARRSSLLLVAAGITAWLALASRQNAVAAIVLAGVAIAWRYLGSRISRHRPVRRVLTLAAGGILLTAVMLASQVVALRFIRVRNVHPEQYVMIYDMAMLSTDLGRNLFPPDVMPRRELSVVKQYFNIDSVNPLLFSPDPPVRTPLADGAVRSLRTAWRKAVTAHPFDYLEGRWELWLRQVSLTREADFIYHPVVDPNQLGLRVEFPALNAVAKDYVETFADQKTLDGGPLHTVWAYLVLGGVGVVVLLRRTVRPDRRLLGLLALASITHQAGLFFGAMGTQYRFQFPVVAVGAVMVFAVAQQAWAWRKGGSPPRAVDGSGNARLGDDLPAPPRGGQVGREEHPEHSHDAHGEP